MPVVRSKWKLPGSSPDQDVGERRTALYELYLHASFETTDDQLTEALNKHLRVQGRPEIHRSTVCQHLTFIRRRLFEQILAQLEPDEERVLFVRTDLPDSALERARREALDLLVRAAVQDRGLSTPDEHRDPPREATKLPHLLNRWWNDPMLDGRPPQAVGRGIRLVQPARPPRGGRGPSPGRRSRFDYIGRPISGAG